MPYGYNGKILHVAPGVAELYGMKNLDIEN